LPWFSLGRRAFFLAEFKKWGGRCFEKYKKKTSGQEKNWGDRFSPWGAFFPGPPPGGGAGLFNPPPARKKRPPKKARRGPFSHCLTPFWGKPGEKKRPPPQKKNPNKISKGAPRGGGGSIFSGRHRVWGPKGGGAPKGGAGGGGGGETPQSFPAKPGGNPQKRGGGPLGPRVHGEKTPPRVWGGGRGAEIRFFRRKFHFESPPPPAGF